MSSTLPVLDRNARDRHARRDATHVRLTARGRFVANDVCAAFVVAA
jgi:coproporphyrinogen III oxidase-like Fe-S oxidoreductase